MTSRQKFRFQNTEKIDPVLPLAQGCDPKFHRLHKPATKEWKKKMRKQSTSTGRKKNQWFSRKLKQKQTNIFKSLACFLILNEMMFDSQLFLIFVFILIFDALDS